MPDVIPLPNRSFYFHSFQVISAIWLSQGFSSNISGNHGAATGKFTVLRAVLRDGHTPFARPGEGRRRQRRVDRLSKEKAGRVRLKSVLDTSQHSAFRRRSGDSRMPERCNFTCKAKGRVGRKRSYGSERQRQLDGVAKQ
jgi:hypothetical protein